MSNRNGMLRLDPLAIVSEPPVKTQVQAPMQQAIAPQPNMTAPAQSGVGGVNTTGMLATQTPATPSGMTWEKLEEQRLAGNPFSVSQDFVASDLAERQSFADLRGVEFGVGEDISGYDKEYVGTDTANQREMSSQGQLGGAVDAGTAQRLKSLGLETEYKQDEYRGYTYNPNTGQYDYYDNTPSNFEQYAPAIIKAGVMAAATAGLGGAVSAGLNVSATTGSAIASGAMTAAQGGDLEDVIISAATAGLAEEVKAAEAVAGAADATKEAIAYADTMKNVQAGVNLVKAVDNKDVLGAVSSGMQLAGIPSVVDYTEDLIANSLSETAGMGLDGALTDWAFYNSDHLAEATVKFADTLISEGDLGEATKDAVVKYIRDGGGIEDLFPKGGDLGIDFEVPEVIEQVAQVIADGASAINRNFIKPAVQTVEALGSSALAAADEAIRLIPGTKEDAEQLLEDAKDFVEPGVEVVRNTGRAIEEGYGTAEDFVKEEVAPVVRETGRDIRETVDPVANVVRDTGRAIEEGYDTVEDFVKEEVAPRVRETGRDVRDWLDENTPDIDLPDFPDFPDIDLSGGGGGQQRTASTPNGMSQEDRMRLNYIQLLNPGLTKGFEYADPFANPFLKGNI